MRRQFYRGGRALILGVALAMALVPKIGMEAPVAAAEPTPEVIDLGVLPGTNWSYADVINSRGVIAGRSGFGSPDSPGRFAIYAVRWDSDGQIMPLRLMEAYNYVTGINDNNDISGYSDTFVLGFRGPHAVRWDSTGAGIPLPDLPGYTNSRTVGIAADATVAGTDFGPLGVRRAVRWDPDGYVVDLGTLPGGTSSYATAINTHGEVAGNSTASDGEHAVRWDRAGRITDLGPGGSAQYINDAGEVAGYLDNRPVRWDMRGNVTFLSELPDGCTVAGINNEGLTIGNCYAANRAVRWDRDGQLTVLEGPPDSPQATAVVINNPGEVAGTAAGAVRWDRQGTVTELGTLPGHSGGWVQDMNDQGAVVGASLIQGSYFSYYRAMLWRR